VLNKPLNPFISTGIGPIEIPVSVMSNVFYYLSLLTISLLIILLEAYRKRSQTKAELSRMATKNGWKTIFSRGRIARTIRERWLNGKTRGTHNSPRCGFDSHPLPPPTGDRHVSATRFKPDRFDFRNFEEPFIVRARSLYTCSETAANCVSGNRLGRLPAASPSRKRRFSVIF
jgi:hypothetical protein